MYNSNNNNNYRNNRSRQKSGNFDRRGGGRGVGRPLDTNLFIKKAVKTKEIEEFIPQHNFSDYKIIDKLKQIGRAHV